MNIRCIIYLYIYIHIPYQHTVCIMPAHQVAKMLVELHQECLRGDFSSIQRMQSEAATGAAKSQRQVVGAHRNLTTYLNHTCKSLQGLVRIRGQGQGSRPSWLMMREVKEMSHTKVCTVYSSLMWGTALFRGGFLPHIIIIFTNLCFLLAVGPGWDADGGGRWQQQQ